MELLNNIPPAFLLIIGAIALLALPANARKVGAIALAALGFFAITQLSEGTRGNPEFLGHTLEMLRVDSTSKAFGYIFTISAFGAFIFRGASAADCKTQPPWFTSEVPWVSFSPGT